MRRFGFWLSGFLWLSAVPLWAGSATATNVIEALVRDLTAVERVYYNHRTDDKPPFEQAAPRDAIEKVVRQDRLKEAVLKKVYGIEVTPAQIESETQRLTASARFPELLAELKQALGNDPDRFARVIVRPIVVERLLRDKFDQDGALQAAPRREIEKVRAQLLEIRRNADHRAPVIRPGQVLVSDVPTNIVDQLVTILKNSSVGRSGEVTWRLTPAAAQTNSPSGAQGRPPAANGGTEWKFEDLPLPLQEILRVQLREPGDISAVIETPGACLLLVAKAVRGDQLHAAALSISKLTYEEWLQAQAGKVPLP